VPLWSTADEPALLECGDLSDLSPLWPWRQNESGDKSPHSIWDSLFVRLLRASRGKLTPNCTSEIEVWSSAAKPILRALLLAPQHIPVGLSLTTSQIFS